MFYSDVIYISRFRMVNKSNEILLVGSSIRKGGEREPRVWFAHLSPGLVLYIHAMQRGFANFGSAFFSPSLPPLCVYIFHPFCYANLRCRSHSTYACLPIFPCK